MYAALLAVAMSQGQPGLLSVSGPNLHYKGKVVKLRGACVGDIVLARENRPLSDYQRLGKEWGANCVRIGVAPTTWRNADKAQTMKVLKAEVNAGLKAGMFVLIDWHTIGWPDGYTQIPTWEGTPKDLYDSDFELGLDFWKACAKAFGKDGRVGFHLWCEPVYQERDWEVPAGSTWPKLRPWFIKLTQAIRKEGAKNLLLTTGNRWAYDLVGIRANPLPDKNTAYMWHVYAGHDNNDPVKWERMLDNLHTKFPVVVSEWGFEKGSTSHFKGGIEEFGNPFLKFMEDRGLHWTAWCWHNSWGPKMFETDWKTTTEFGTFVKRALAKHAKSAVRP